LTNKAAHQSGTIQPPSTSRDFCTDLGNARRLVTRHGDNIRYVAQWNQWIVWNKTSRRWEIDQDGAVTRFAVDFRAQSREMIAHGQMQQRDGQSPAATGERHRMRQVCAANRLHRRVSIDSKRPFGITF
jgi:hypothetical protein